MIDEATRLVLTSGSVYSQRFPFSTSLIVDGGRIAWIGDSGGLNGQLIDSDTVIDCSGSLIAPLFFDARRSSIDSVDGAVATALVEVDSHPTAQFRTNDQDWRVERLEEDVAARSTLIADDSEIPEDVTTLVSTGTFAIVGPAVSPRALSMLATAGVPFAFGSYSSETNPWEWMRNAVYGAPEGLSARAAYNACTRSGWRLLGEPQRGELNVGEVATFGVWSSDELEVQVPDDRIRAWSTDIRAGTPALPNLKPGTHLPRLTATVIAGEYRSVR